MAPPRELDAFFFDRGSLARDDVDYVRDTFPITKRRDEQEHSTYRAKDAILAVYDELAACEAAGHPYASPPIPSSGHQARR